MPPGKCFSGPAAALVLTLFLVLPATAPAFLGDRDGALGLDGSLRVIGAVSRNYDFPYYFGRRDTDDYLQALLRLTLAGHPSDRLSYEVHLVSALTYASAGRPGQGPGLAGDGDRTRYRALDKYWEWNHEQYTTGRTWFDRFNVRLALPRADLTVGRQAITLGKAFFWNPLDVYLPFDPAQFDRDYKPGVDGIRLDVYLGRFSGLTFIWVLGRELDLNNQYRHGDRTWDASWYGSSLLARYYADLAGWDLAVQGGKIYGGWQLGFGLVGERDGLELRAEAAWFHPEDSPLLSWPPSAPVFEEHLTAVLGLGYRFENSLHLEAEFLYHGGGETEDLTLGLLRQMLGAAVHAGRRLAGFSASYELTPLITGRLTVIHSLTDSSTQVQPLVTWSLSDNSELVLGASLNLGRRPRLDPLRGPVVQSEFGAYPDTLFAEYKVYF
ncbi:MAG: hypothetical protein AB1896_18795 [Thermodesulfobacteriota bacterium]